VVHAIGSQVPCIDSSVYIAWNAEVAGAVTLAAESSVWFSAVLRGDIAAIEIGKASNIQDGAVVHVDTDVPCRLGSLVTVGHRAVLHSCDIGNGCLVGMGAIILSGSKIGAHSIVGAGSLVLSNSSFPDGSLILGSPARLVRPLRAEEIDKLEEGALRYAALAREASLAYTEIP
jgi:carbonic anhydrase/acetyltransferase-like protein (isoleucine patch superfamily)